MAGPIRRLFAKKQKMFGQEDKTVVRDVHVITCEPEDGMLFGNTMTVHVFNPQEVVWKGVDTLDFQTMDVKRFFGTIALSAEAWMDFNFGAFVKCEYDRNNNKVTVSEQ